MRQMAPLPMAINAQWRTGFVTRLGELLSSHAVGVIPDFDGSALCYRPPGAEQSLLEPLVRVPFADTRATTPLSEAQQARLDELSPNLLREQWALQTLIDGAAAEVERAAASRRRPPPPRDWYQETERDAGALIRYSRDLRESMSTIFEEWKATRAFFGSLKVLVERFHERAPCTEAMLAEAGLAASKRAFLLARAAERGETVCGGNDRPDTKVQFWRYAGEASAPQALAETAAKAWARSLALFQDEPSERYRIDRALHSSWDASLDTLIAVLRESARWSFQHGAEEKGIADSLRVAWALASQKHFGEADREELTQEISGAAWRLQRNGERGFASQLRELAAAAERLPLNFTN